MLLAAAGDELLQILSRVHDVLPQGVRGDLRIARPAGFEQLSMGLAGQVQIARENKVQPRVTITVVIQRFQESHHYRSVRGCVQR